MATFEWGRKLENLIAANMSACLKSAGVMDEDFPLGDYSDLGLCKLRNENLFRIKKDHRVA